MSSPPRHKRGSYSSPYKIFRRIRFIRYKKRLKIRSEKEIAAREKLEHRQKIRELKEFRSREMKSRKLKEKADKLQSKRLKEELKTEFRQREEQSKKEHELLAREDRKKARLEKKKAKEQNIKALYRNIKTAAGNFILSYRSLSIRSIRSKYSDFRLDAPKRRRFSIILFNSTVIFLLSYFVLFLVGQAMTVLAGSLFDYPSTVFYYEIYFNIPPAAWFHDSVRTIYSAGPVAVFVIGIVFLIIYSNIRESALPFKLFFLWGFLHGVNMLFGALLVGTLFDKGVGHVISWMYIMDTGRVLYSTVSIFLLVIAGLISTRQFLFSGNTYYNEINRFNRTAVIFAQVLFPYILGNFVLLIIRQPRFVFYDTFVAFTMGICIISVLATYRSYNDLYFEEGDKKARIAWKETIALATVIVIFRIILEIGIRF